MREILIYRWININDHTDYVNLHKSIDKWFNGQCPNFGNKLWYQGLISEISTPENKIDYYNSDMKIEEINEKYDLIIYPMANIFSVEFSNGLPQITEFVKQLKIPIFVISCGAQANGYDELNELCDNIGEVSKDFISSVYNTGGQFALRGYFTAEFFSKLGFNNPAVVGCPSLFQSGRNLKIKKKVVSKEEFKPAFNGNFVMLRNYFSEYDNSIFYDQDIFYNILYNNSFFNKKDSSKSNITKLLKYNLGGIELAELVYNDRIRLLADMWDWQNSFVREKISFSFGSRIHGNIMALLSGVPAVVVGFDSRTREMAEFYDIPCIQSFDDIKPKNLYALYESLDYSKFNNSFEKKYDSFENFLIKCGIVNKINTSNKYLNKYNGEYPTKSDYINKDIKKYAKRIIDKKCFYGPYLGILRLYLKYFRT